MNTGIKIALGVIGVVGLGTGLYFIFKDKKDKPITTKSKSKEDVYKMPESIRPSDGIKFSKKLKDTTPPAMLTVFLPSVDVTFIYSYMLGSIAAISLS